MKPLVWLLVFVASTSFAADPRFCGPPARDADGRIIRSQAVLREFRKLHQCPSTGLSTGACPGWSIDHVIPLSEGGCDALSNLQYLPNAIKSCAGKLCKDRWERKVYGNPSQRVDLE